MIVSYNGPPSLREHVAALRLQVDALVIVDNGSQSECLAMLQQIRADYDCKIIYNRSNLGVARALNIGSDFAIQNGFDWIVTFDQDSEVSETFIASLFQTYNDNSSPRQVGMLLPTCIEPALQLDLSQIRCTFVNSKGTILTGITSGAMTKAEVFQDCGRFREDLFIDCIDTEFCLRINRSGWRILQSRNALLFHALGHISSRTILGRTIRTTNHSAGRRYYRTRNRLLLWRLYFRSFPNWVADDMLAFARETINLLLMETQKAAKIVAILRGMRDALLGHFGYRIKL